MESLPSDTTKKVDCLLDLQTSLLTHFSEEKKLKEPEKGLSLRMFGFNERIKKVNELNLIQSSLKKNQTVLVCGHIEDPINDYIILYTLNRAFGNEPDSKDVYLDKNGNFRIEAKLLHSGLVILVQPNKKQNVNTAAFLLYANPGDSIYVKTTFALQKIEVPSIMNKDELRRMLNLDKSQSEKEQIARIQKIYNNPNRNDTIIKTPKSIMMYESVEISGDHKAEADFLMKYQQKWGLPPFNTTYNRLFFDEGTPGIETYFKAIDKLKSMISAYKETMSPESAAYLEREIQALLYTRLYQAMPAKLFPNGIVPRGNLIPEQLESMVYGRLDTLEIQRIYNDYGLFSRDLATGYIWYKYKQLNPTNRIVMFPRTLNPTQDLEKITQFMKIIMNGSMLYRTIAQNLSTNTLTAGIMYSNPSSVWKPYALDMLALMQKRSNNPEFNREIESLFSYQLKWKDSHYVPKTTFLNLQHKKAQLNSFISKKPAIVSVNSNWSSGRYEMDEAVKNYPEFNFVLINEGSNFDLWKDWNTRAESLSHQLFLPNDSINLSDIFQDNLRASLKTHVDINYWMLII